MTPAPLDRSRPPGPGKLRPFVFPRIHRFEIDNGIPVLYARTERLPVATLSLLLPAGAIREDDEHAGVGTLTGSLLESGTSRLDAAGIAERVEQLGVRVHVGTSWEVASVDFTSLTNTLAEAAELAAHLVADAGFPEAEVERLRAEQLAGILQRRAEPRGLANEMANRFIFSPASPFSRSVSGTLRSVERLGRSDVVEHHRRWYSPSGAALIVAGNLSLEAARRTAETAFGGWQGPETQPVEAAVDARIDGRQVVVVERPGAVQSEIRVGHLGVPRNTPDFFGILVMNTILGGAFSSRLNLNLRERHGFTYGASSTFVMRRRPGPFLVSTAVQTEVTGAAVAEILAELHRIREEPPLPEELADARQYVAGTYPLRLETTDGVASRLAELYVHGLPDSYLEEFASRVLAVEAEQVQAAATRYLRPDKATILVVGDASRVVAQLERLGAGPVEVVTPEVLG